jgi:hypothetical protein
MRIVLAQKLKKALMLRWIVAKITTPQLALLVCVDNIWISGLVWLYLILWSALLFLWFQYKGAVRDK